MPPDSVRAADTRGWLARARMDLRGAEVDLAASPPLCGDAAFRCQQAIEKALKAFERVVGAFVRSLPADLEG